MKIKEVERLAGITSDNVRYYEKEGLIKPSRNAENNYREYTEDDVETLIKIRMLRTIGIPIADIREVIEGKMDLSEAAVRRQQVIAGEKAELAKASEICDLIISEDAKFYTIDPGEIEKRIEQSPELLSRMDDVISNDTTKVHLDREGFDRTIFRMTAGAYIMNAALTLIVGGLLGSVISSGAGSAVLLVLIVIMSMVVFIRSGWSAEIKFQQHTYWMAAVSMTPLVIFLLSMVSDPVPTGRYGFKYGWSPILDRVGVDEYGSLGALIFMLLAAFCAVMYVVRKGLPDFQRRRKISVLLTLAFAAACCILIILVTSADKTDIGVAAIASVLILFAGMTWTYDDTDRNDINLFYAVNVATKIINPVALVIKGKGYPGNYFR